MHAFLVIGDSKSFIDKFEGKKIEFPLSKIEDVRELSNFTKLKVTEKTIILIKDFDNATTVAQNAFLKALEEPQENLSYVLTATNINNVLPTIISRCEVVEFSNTKVEISKEDKERLDSFINGKIGRRFLLISKINKRDDAIIFIKDLIAYGHNIFLEKPDTVNFMENAINTLQNLTANGNVSLQLTNFLIKIDGNG